jgi:hypothetical protein
MTPRPVLQDLLTEAEQEPAHLITERFCGAADEFLTHMLEYLWPNFERRIRCCI